MIGNEGFLHISHRLLDNQGNDSVFYIAMYDIHNVKGSNETIQ